MSITTYAAIFGGLLVCNFTCWLLSPSKGAASMNAYAAGINSMGLLYTIFGVAP